ncbi:hypothetical protein Btru_060447, partial [Bulinus truncatus]
MKVTEELDMNQSDNYGDEDVLDQNSVRFTAMDYRDGTSEKKIDPEVVTEYEDKKPLIYRVSQTPPLHLLLFFGLQQSLLTIGNPLSVTIIVSEVVCAQQDEAIKTYVLSATFLMIGISTFMMSTFGVRLPVFQGPASTYLIPLIAMSSLPEWKCPSTFREMRDDNTTVLMMRTGNGTIIPARDVIESKLSQLSGSLMLAGGLHFLIGATGLVGVLIRFIGPITIVPAITLVGLFIYEVNVKLCQANWLVAVIAILTEAGAISDDPKSIARFARTDSRLYIVKESDWFTFPYPGKYGGYAFSLGAFISFFMATIASVLDSIGDYNAVARISRVPPPPKYVFNRGIAVEGLMSFISGTLGCCHATVSYGGNIGAMAITR